MNEWLYVSEIMGVNYEGVISAGDKKLISARIRNS